MKKLISMIIVAVLVMSFTAIPVFAYQNITEGDYLYESKFVDYYITPTYQYEGDWYSYNECYYHHVDESDPESEIDWVLVNAGKNTQAPWMAKRVVGDRVFWKSSGSSPFQFRYGLYDVKKGSFKEITSDILDDYEDLAEVMDELKVGTPIGDADLDDMLTILDATYIQRVAAQLCEYDYNDYISEFHKLGNADISYISDADMDGNRNVMDATYIQRKLAGK